MKCFTVTNDGVVPGIEYLKEPYPHVAVGDTKLSSSDYRLVEIDPALAGEHKITACSYTIDTKNSGNRKVSYKLVPPSGKDDDLALVKFDAHGNTPGQRTFYDMPRHTLALANGWRLASDRNPQAETPVNLVVLKKGDEVKVERMVDIRKPSVPLFSVRFDGTELKLTRARAAA